MGINNLRKGVYNDFKIKKTAQKFICTILTFSLILPAYQSFGAIKTYALTDASVAAKAMGAVCVEDNFDDYSEGASLHEKNGWISQKRAEYSAGVVYESHTVENGVLKAWDDSDNGWGNFLTMRSMDDAAVNQRATVDVLNMDNLYNAYANLHLRYMIVHDYKTATSYRPCLANNYFVSVDRKEMVIRARTTANSSSSNYWWGTDSFYTVASATYEKGAYKEGHEYRIEFIAQGTYPTVLTATLYDITDDMRVVATVSGEDSADVLQSAGTVALSHKWNKESGREYTLFDNFKYEQTDVIMANVNDDFTGSEIDSVWSGPENANTTTAFDGNKISLSKNDQASEFVGGVWGNERFEHEAALMRPMFEAAVNQTAEIKYNLTDGNIEKTGVGIYAHVQDQRPTDNNCYRANVTYAESNKDSTQTETVNLYVGNRLVATKTHGWGYATTDHRLSITTEKVDNGIKITVVSLKWEDSTWKTRVTLEYTDTDSDLQGAGTTGFTIYKKWNSTVGQFDYFKYNSKENVSTFKALEAENEGVYKNKYTKAKRTDTFDAVSANQAGGANAGEAGITTSLNHDGAFMAYPVYTETAGAYPFRAILKMSGADTAAYNKASKYVMLVANGTAYRLPFYAPLNTYATTGETDVQLKSGVNIIYIYAPTSLLAEKVAGIKVDYDKLYTTSEISIFEGGTFSVTGDANTDDSVDIRDLVRFKKFVDNNDSVEINYDGMGFLLDNSVSESWDGASLNTLRSFLLTMGEDDTDFAEKSWLTFTEPRSVNPLAIIEETKGGADEKALARQQSIVNSAAEITAESVGTGGKVYYFASNGKDSNDGLSPETPKQSPYRLKDMTLKSGDVVLFARGSVFRQGNTISQEDENYNWMNCLVELKSGVSYGAYGSGAKPVFSGSSRNYAGSTVGWTNLSGSIWKCSLPLQDAGNILFDDGTVGVKKASLEDLAQNNDFYHDVTNKILYLYCEGNPSEIFNNIEIGVKRPVFAARSEVSNVKIDNLSIKHCGAHGIDFLGDNNNNTITNCELSWMGGSYQSDTLRYGNAVQFWGNASGNTVRNCWIYDCYDAGLTFQGGNGSNYNNIAFTGNLIQRCCYSVEFFIKLPTDNSTPTGSLKNITINDNIMQFAGHGFTKQRPETEKASHINGWTTNVFNNTENVRIQKNIFDISTRNIFYWSSAERPTGVTVINNTYYQTNTPHNVVILWGANNQLTANSKNSLVSAITNIGDNVAVENKDTQINWIMK